LVGAWGKDLTVLDIRLLGPFRVICDQRGDITPSGKRAQAVIAMVALSEHGERSRAWLQARLWSDRPAAQGSASLRQELSRLRRGIGSRHLVTVSDRVLLRDVRVDVLDMVEPGSVAASFIAAEVPELLEGLEIRDEEFEDWLRLERSHWSERIEGLASRAEPLVTHADPPAAARVPAAVRGGAHGAILAPRRPTIGIMPCVVRSERRQLTTIGEMICDLAAKMALENGYFAVFDFRDLSGNFSGIPSEAGNPVHGPDLLLSVRLSEIGSMLEIALALRAVGTNRVVWTQSYAAEASEESLLSAGKIPEFVNQAIEASEHWLSRNSEDEKHCAARLTLSAAHRAFCLGNMDLALAQSQLEAAYDLDGSVVQLGWLAFLECVRVGEGHPQHSKSSIERVRMLTAKALQEDRGNSLTLALLGHANAFVLRDYAVAEDLVAESLRINPHRAAGWDARAMLNFYTGDLEDGYLAAQRARALGRFSPYSFWYEASCGIGASMVGRHAEAIRHGSLVLAQRPDFKPMIRHMLASFALQGEMAEAQKLYRHWQVLEEDISIAKLRDAGYPLPNPDSIAMIERGLIKAGVALAPA